MLASSVEKRATKDFPFLTVLKYKGCMSGIFSPFIRAFKRSLWVGADACGLVLNGGKGISSCDVFRFFACVCFFPVIRS